MLTTDMEHLTSTLTTALPRDRSVIRGTLAARAASTAAVFAARAAVGNDAAAERAQLRAEIYAQLSVS
jgi:hypothetical protein